MPARGKAACTRIRGATNLYERGCRCTMVPFREVRESMHARCLLPAAALFAFAPFSSASIRLYVDAAAAPGGHGFTWGTALNRLEDALAYAATHSGAGAVNEIWVAQGTYVPSTILDPNATFLMVAGASMY